MGRFGIGQPVRRVEDNRLLTGSGRYTGDIALDGQVWGHVLRSPHAHATIRSIDPSPAPTSFAAPKADANDPARFPGGEAGAVGAPPAVMNAILDALSERGVGTLDMPATPERVWRAIRDTA